MDKEEKIIKTSESKDVKETFKSDNKPFKEETIKETKVNTEKTTPVKKDWLKEIICFVKKHSGIINIAIIILFIIISTIITNISIRNYNRSLTKWFKSYAEDNQRTLTEEDLTAIRQNVSELIDDSDIIQHPVFTRKDNVQGVYYTITGFDYEGIRTYKATVTSFDQDDDFFIITTSMGNTLQIKKDMSIMCMYNEDGVLTNTLHDINISSDNNVVERTFREQDNTDDYIP